MGHALLRRQTDNVERLHTAFSASPVSDELGRIMVGRVEGERVPLPARFQLIGATNPCPCGGGAPGACECNERSRSRYIGRLSGPLLDRFDLRVAVARPATDDLFGGEPGESTASMLPRITAARRRALERSGTLNAALDEHGLNEFAPLSKAASATLQGELEKGRLTARGLHRVWRVARTLADLDENAGVVEESNVLTALSMRARIGLSAVGQAA